jgi:mannose-1-phosphate guanylyltransferase
MPSRRDYAVILAGGGGTRLWPSSRRTRPKQLLRLGGRESLLAATVRRVTPAFGLDRILVVTARDQEAAILAELPDLPRGNVIAEPEPRNTAGAIQLAASLATLRTGPASVLAVLPADHHISDERAFRGRLRLALGHASKSIVTIGIRPSHPETGFGYIKLGATVRPARAQVFDVDAFVEKPDRKTALRYMRSGRYLWNAGMFFLSAERFAAETKRSLPRLHELGRRLETLKRPMDFAATVRKHYRDVEAISVDYGIMERAIGLRVVVGEFGWSDVGSWSALADVAKARDPRGNILVGDVLVVEGTDNIVVSDPGAPFVGAVGVENLVIVATADAVLVIPRDRAQEVRRVVDALKDAKRTQLLE